MAAAQEQGFCMPWVDQDKLGAETARTGQPEETEAGWQWWSKAHSEDADEAQAKQNKMARRVAVPASLRGSVWTRVSGAQRLLRKRPNLYRDAHKGRFKAEPGAQIDMHVDDVPSFGSTFDLNRLCLTEDGVQRARRVLCCLAFEHQEALYCPWLPVIVASCLHWVTEADAFAIGCALLREPSPLIETRLGSWLLLKAFSDLLKKQLPRAYRRLCLQAGCDYPPPLAQGHPLSGVFMTWFCNELPFWPLMRFLDNFLVEGEKTFYRFGLALVDLWNHTAVGDVVTLDAVSPSKGTVGRRASQMVKALLRSPQVLPFGKGRRNSSSPRGSIATGMGSSSPEGSPERQSPAPRARTNTNTSTDTPRSRTNTNTSVDKPRSRTNTNTSLREEDLPSVTLEEVARAIDCPDRMVTISFSYSFSRDQLRKSKERGYVEAGRAMEGQSGRPQAVGETHNAQLRRGAYSQMALPLEPVLLQESKIADKAMWRSLWADVPIRYHLKDMSLLFTTAQHGYSLRTLYERCDDYSPTILLVQTMGGRRFGAFVSYPWSQRQGTRAYFGNGETFLFQLGPQYKAFQWVGLESVPEDEDSVPPDWFMTADDSRLAVGGGGAGHGLEIDADLRWGWSHKCDTFANQPLAEADRFEIQSVEVWAFEPHRS